MFDEYSKDYWSGSFPDTYTRDLPEKNEKYSLTARYFTAFYRGLAIMDCRIGTDPEAGRTACRGSAPDPHQLAKTHAFVDDC